MSKIEMISTGDLRPHPLLGEVGLMSKLIEREDKMSAEGKEREKHQRKKEILERRSEAMQGDISQNGVEMPLWITDEGSGLLIVDGRHRWTCAKRAGLKKIPCRRVSPGDVVSKITSGLQTKPLSKGAIAYYYVKLHPGVLESTKRGQRSKESGLVRFTKKGLARKAGVDEKLIRQAAELYRMFNDTGAKWTAETNVDLAGLPMFVEGAKEKFEDAIFTPGNGLGGVKSGVLQMVDYPIPEGGEEYHGKVDYCDRILKSLSGMERYFKQYEGLPIGNKAVIRTQWSDLLEVIPADLLEIMKQHQAKQDDER